MRLYVQDKETDGEQFVTDVGTIDVLALDKNGDFVVIEIKGSNGQGCWAAVEVHGMGKEEAGQAREGKRNHHRQEGF